MLWRSHREKSSKYLSKYLSKTEKRGLDKKYLKVVDGDTGSEDE